MRLIRPPARNALACAVVLVALSACGSDAPVAPDPPAYLAITTQTDGRLPDPDGYTISVAGGAPMPVGINQAVIVEVAGASSTVELAGQAANCMPHGNPASSHTLISGDTVDVIIAITCFEDPVVYGQYGGDAIGWTMRVVDSSGGTSVELTTLPGLDNNFFYGGANVFNPSKTHLTLQSASNSDGFGEYDIYVVSLNKSERYRHRTSGLQAGPHWSPLGDRIAFSGFDWGEPSDLFTASPDLTTVTRLTQSAETDFIGRGAWSPDGSRIAFSTAIGVHLMDADGSNRVRLSDPGDTLVAPLDEVMGFSPDGSRVLYLRSSANPEAYALRVVDTDGSNDLELTEDVGYFGRHSFGPDGRIYYTRCPGGGSDCTNQDVWVMNADGTSKAAITTGGQTAFSGSFNATRTFGGDVPAGTAFLTYTGNMNGGPLKVIGLDGAEIATLATGIIDAASWR